MSIASVKAFFATYGREGDVLEKQSSSATVELAAEVLGVEPGRIAKSMLFKLNDGGCVMILMAGDMKVDNRKYKDQFHVKAAICPPEEMVLLTGHELGGNCPFGMKTPVDSYLDLSLKRFPTVFPACGSHNSMIELTCDELETFSNAVCWADLCVPKG